MLGPPGLRASGGQHYGAYGLGPDCAWFVSLTRNTEADLRPGSSSSQAPDSWGTVTDAAVMESIKQELRERFEGWRAVQQMLDRDVAAMIRVSCLGLGDCCCRQCTASGCVQAVHCVSDLCCAAPAVAMADGVTA